MSFLAPAPLTIVVFSLSITTFLARPSMLSVTFSSLMPRSSDIAVPPVRVAMSSSIALRRSPKPGAFTAATFRPPRSLSMIAMRGLQGYFGGVLIPMAFTLVFTKLPKAQQPIGLAMFSIAVTFAPAIGPTIGGYLTENYGWQTIFFVNVVPTAVMVVLLFATLERQPMALALLP